MGETAEVEDVVESGEGDGVGEGVLEVEAVEEVTAGGAVEVEAVGGVVGEDVECEFGAAELLAFY